MQETNVSVVTSPWFTNTSDTVNTVELGNPLFLNCKVCHRYLGDTVNTVELHNSILLNSKVGHRYLGDQVIILELGKPLFLNCKVGHKYLKRFRQYIGIQQSFISKLQGRSQIPQKSRSQILQKSRSERSRRFSQ